MKIISINANGIRAAVRKGLFDWLKIQKADVICLQETKAQVEVLGKENFELPGYHHYFNDAEKKGYSGVGIYSLRKPDKIITKLGWAHADKEGRYIQADFGRLSVASLYMPSGSSADLRQQVKFDFMEKYFKILKKQVSMDRDFIICGDWNIVHKEIDIKNFKSNQKNSGCLPEERAWLDDVFYKMGFVDAFRVLNKKSDQYTWWSNRGRAWDNNVGWRIDYQVISPNLEENVRKVSIYKAKRFSDHAPLIVEYDYKF